MGKVETVCFDAPSIPHCGQTPEPFLPRLAWLHHGYQNCLLCYFKALHAGENKGAFQECVLSSAHGFLLLSDKQKSMPQGHGFSWSY
ncbi:hypothetical protein [Oscillibacter valericigenes]|uniref:hypothetical protein n=1 Tax=Oscillibacter valericigenes TaxID=351091 RepID=UPI001F4058E7|nr:hypothetical protein [Oscillibacter valericigenes]